LPTPVSFPVTNKSTLFDLRRAAEEKHDAWLTNLIQRADQGDDDAVAVGDDDNVNVVPSPMGGAAG
jgi:hypothetical protein